MTSKGDKPARLGDILGELFARRGYARVQTAHLHALAWTEAAGQELARHSRAGAIKRGTLEVLIANSTLLQELTFRKHEILQKLEQLLPDQRIKNLRCRVGPVG